MVLPRWRVVWGVRVRDERGILWDGDWHRVRTTTNPNGQWTRKNAENVLERAIANYDGNLRGHVFRETVAIEPEFHWSDWLIGDVVDPADVPREYRADYSDTLERAARAAKDYGRAIYVSDSFRTRAEQQARWDEYQNGGPIAAYPGTSDHERGLALDIPHAREVGGLIRALRAQRLIDDVPSEDWHVTNYAAKYG